MNVQTPRAGCTRRLITTLAGITTAALSLWITAALAEEALVLSTASTTGPESMLVKSLQEISESRMDSALNGIEQLLKTNPNFRLAHLIKGDLLLARARPIHTIGETGAAIQQPIDDLREEARARLQRHLAPIPLDMTPKYLLQMPPEQKYAIIADTGRSRLYLYKNVDGSPRYLADYYISTGKNGSQKLKEGDKKTPIGVYFVTDNLPRQKLSDFYGGMAFPINYPNEWDKRHGRSGYGIWLHGTPPDTYSRPPRASDGCVVLANDDLSALASTLQVGITSVIISDQMEWVKPHDAAALRRKLAQHLERWRRSWESGNMDDYVAIYGNDFSSGEQKLTEWMQDKRQAGAEKNPAKVGISNVGIFLYPGRDDLAVINFDEEHSSNDLSNKIKKRQYWMKEDKSGSWKIIYESAA
ncbi:L,D-transpeptidase family protein [Nitrosospira multiformis]|uniref:Murein L,D-transpeptidase YafK n=1 Tax=Nitrosospira multiformis TaxID=1231 RepID=A0A1I7FQE0_9PROT|nr:L,D-transpeptidase family protein [Nitrosospira multiformis]SFU38429.1 Murein L,D-transpeptidase YafK [Nitrosospira multiformis]